MHRTYQHRGRDDHHTRVRLFWGIGLIVAGSLFLLGRLVGLGVRDPSHLWPVIIALAGLARIVAARRFAHVAKGAFLIVLAGWLYACIENLWGWTFATTWPIIVIALGVKAVAKGIFRLQKQSPEESE